MMLRVFLFILLAGLGAARASDKIDAPAEGASAIVTQPHVTAELIPESTTVEAGKPFDVALHLHMDEGWHTYWINPGDAGLATTIKWTLPPGFTAGPIQWPTPEKHPMGPLMTYGYADDVYLLTTITPPKSDLPQHFDLKAKADWLVCQEECIPGKADLTVTLDSGLMNFRLPTENKELFAEARKRLPAENTVWDVSGDYSSRGEVSDAVKSAPGLIRRVFEMVFESKAGNSPTDLGHIYFFPEQGNVLSPNDPETNEAKPSSHGFLLLFDLIQNGEMPEKLSGVLVSDRPLIDSSKAIHVANITIFNGFPASTNAPSAVAPNPAGSSDTPAAATSSAPAAQRAAATANASTPSSFPGAGPAPSTLLAVLGAAFIGGLILNLMPCVLPVLSLKVFSLIRHAGDNPKAAWVQGVAFTAGVVLSFWVLAGVLLALRAAGGQLGWGFQMQSPGFVAALIVLFFLIGLNLFGVFEIGSSLVGLDAKAASRTGGSMSSFLNGALATLAATPCTAPFMGSALGFAAQQPAVISLLVFTFLALGMATPYLLLTIFPQTLRFVPKPGAWMESLKQFMGFLLMGTVIFLLYVFGALTSNDGMIGMLGALLLVSVAAWIYGRWSSPVHSLPIKFVAFILALIFLAGGLGLALKSRTATTSSDDVGDGPLSEEVVWLPWSPEAVQNALDHGKSVFVDFTAAWCLSCKVNERLALNTDVVRKAFADKNVALFYADWTHSDPLISQTLQQYHRDGVPLYLLYSPKAKAAPQVLPEVLTPGIVLDALNKI